MRNLYLIRHGQARFGEANYDLLSDRGIRQSALLGEWLVKTAHAPGLFISGTMERHRQTAQACFEGWGLGGDRAYMSDAQFDEFDMHAVLQRHRPDLNDWTAIAAFMAKSADPHREIQTLLSESVIRWICGLYDADYAESWPDFRARCIAGVMRAVETAADEQSIYIFTSGGPIAAICQYFLGLPDKQLDALLWVILNSSVTRLAFGSQGGKVHSFNGVAHLEYAGDASLLTYR
jgi:broad specificity phosphatase PhoE